MAGILQLVGMRSLTGEKWRPTLCQPSSFQRKPVSYLKSTPPPSAFCSGHMWSHLWRVVPHYIYTLAAFPWTARGPEFLSVVADGVCEAVGHLWRIMSILTEGYQGAPVTHS